MKKNIEPEALNQLSGSINYRLELTYMAKKNRHQPTLAEDIIWQEILRFRKTGYKFTRQKPIDRFILDFYCSELNLAVEIDGESHIMKKGTDELRDRFLYQIGIETLRFSNDEVIKQLNIVKDKIINKCSSLTLSRGGGSTKLNRRG